jgi:4a-hydroxytetrahydrobiopterin dehydratase
MPAAKTKPKSSKTTTKKETKPKIPTARKPMTDEAVAKALKSLHGWSHEGDVIQKTYKFSTYLAGLAFATTVGTMAEGFDHHPDILIKWRKVTVSFSTHDADNKVTATDIKVAEAIEALSFKPDF